MTAGLERFSLRGQNAIVTGGSRGLGHAIAAGLVSAGAKVAIVARGEHEATEAAREIGRGTVPLIGDIGEMDISDLVSAAEDRLGGPLHTVVHSAGLQFRAPAEGFPTEQWNRIMQVNLTAPFLLSQEI
jgi:2-deoxy-D-gluconate 3-dehydrogenase